MTKDELLKRKFSSAYEAMYALNDFLEKLDKTSEMKTEANIKILEW